MTQAECDRLRAACADNPRDKAIIELLLQTGIKLSELTKLTLDDIHFEKANRAGERQTGFIRILGNGRKKERMVPQNDKAKLALVNYLNGRESADNDLLFLNRFGEPVSDRGVQKMLRKYLKKAGIGKASIHTLRHTFGAQHIAEGTNPNMFQEIMGFKDPRSTSIYYSLARELRTKQFQETSL